MLPPAQQKRLNMRHYYIIKTIDNNQASEKIEKNWKNVLTTNK